MSEIDMDLQVNDIMKIAASLNISVDSLVHIHKNARTMSYLLNETCLLKISKTYLEEKGKLERVKDFPWVPRIHVSSSFLKEGTTYDFLLMDYLQGSELFHAMRTLTDNQQVCIGKSIAACLTQLHGIKGDAYDIGHYIPTIPRFSGSWKAGHLEYVHLLEADLSDLCLHSQYRATLSAAFSYIHAHIDALDFQTGPVLLHNDFHPKNIIVRKDGSACVIDWECAQFGEADFELAHLFQWCIYPPKEGVAFPLLLKSVLGHLPEVNTIPCLAERLTLYQLEHELNQLLWNGEQQAEERVSRIQGWLHGEIQDWM